MTKLEIAQATWGAKLPDWIEVLAKACDASSQNKVAAKTGISASAISQITRNNYPHDTSNIEEVLRGRLMSEKVLCPGFGPIEKHVCRKWRHRADEPLDPINSQYVQMHRMCRRCSIFLEEHS